MQEFHLSTDLCQIVRASRQYIGQKEQIEGRAEEVREGPSCRRGRPHSSPVSEGQTCSRFLGCQLRYRKVSDVAKLISRKLPIDW